MRASKFSSRDSTTFSVGGPLDGRGIKWAIAIGKKVSSEVKQRSLIHKKSERVKLKMKARRRRMKKVNAAIAREGSGK